MGTGGRASKNSANKGLDEIELGGKKYHVASKQYLADTMKRLFPNIDMKTVNHALNRMLKNSTGRTADYNAWAIELENMSKFMKEFPGVEEFVTALKLEKDWSSGYNGAMRATGDLLIGDAVRSRDATDKILDYITRHGDDVAARFGITDPFERATLVTSDKANLKIYDYYGQKLGLKVSWDPSIDEIVASPTLEFLKNTPNSFTRMTENGRSLSTTYVHEMGHFVDLAINTAAVKNHESEDWVSYWVNGTSVSTGGYGRLDASNPRILNHSTVRMIDSALKQVGAKSLREITKMSDTERENYFLNDLGLSRYSGSAPLETIAEALRQNFTYGKKASPFSKAIWNEAKKYWRKYYGTK